MPQEALKNPSTPQQGAQSFKVLKVLPSVFQGASQQGFGPSSGAPAMAALIEEMAMECWPAGPARWPRTWKFQMEKRLALKAVQLEVRIKKGRSKPIRLPDRTNLGVWNQHNKFTDKKRAVRVGEFIDSYRNIITTVYSTTEEEMNSESSDSSSSSTSN
jgi:hypothetical protein